MPPYTPLPEATVGARLLLVALRECAVYGAVTLAVVVIVLVVIQAMKART